MKKLISRIALLSCTVPFMANAACQLGDGVYAGTLSETTGTPYHYAMTFAMHKMTIGGKTYQANADYGDVYTDPPGGALPGMSLLYDDYIFVRSAKNDVTTFDVTGNYDPKSGGTTRFSGIFDTVNPQQIQVTQYVIASVQPNLKFTGTLFCKTSVQPSKNGVNLS